MTNLESRGELLRHNRVAGNVEDEPWADHSAERAITNMRAAAGSWADIDAEELKAYLYRAREEGTRPLDRQRAT